MRILIVVCTMMLLTCGCAGQSGGSCVPPEDLADSVMKIEGPDLKSHQWWQGSGWFLRETEIVTIDHLVQDLALSSREWRGITITQTGPGIKAARGASVFARIKQSFMAELPEGLHVIELRKPLNWQVNTVQLRESPLFTRERVTEVGYSAGKQTFAHGYFTDEFGWTPPTISSFLGFSLQDTLKQRMRGGSSGGGIFDCSGKLVATHARGYDNNYESGERGALAYGVGVYPIVRALQK